MDRAPRYLALTAIHPGTRYPGFADYQRKTARTIPVIAFTPAGHANAGE